MTTIIRAAGAAEFLALIPRLAGFRPVDSLVLVPFRGSRTLGVMRVDLPPDDAEVDSIAATLIGMVCRVREADAVALVVYTGRELRDGERLAYADLAAAIEAKADACGLRVADALCVGADAWGSYLHPEHGGSLDDLADDALLDLPDNLRGPLGDQSTGTALPEYDDSARLAVARALAALDEAVAAVCSATGTEDAARRDLATLDPQALAAACALEDIPALFEDALDWDPARLRPHDAATLVWCAARPALRDIALVQWCADIEEGDAALDAQLRWEDGEEYPDALASRMWGEGSRPDPTRLDAALELLRHVAALAPAELRAGPLAAAGWLSWALGRSTHAALYAEEALAVEPDHGLSGILLSMVGAGHLPDWAFERPASFHSSPTTAKAVRS